MAEEKKKGFDLAAALGAVSKLDIGNQGRPQLEYIDIDLIDPDPRNRKVEGIPALAQNIALVGLQQPLAVRATPDAEGRYMAISGHRRREALKQLVDEGEEKFRMVPCLVAPPGMSDAMVRLMILSGNMVTQGLTPAQMAEATKEMEDAIYQLKEEGHEFPGKVRDLVAEACGIAGSRVTRLKVIREKLTGKMMEAWEAGTLNEDCAYKLARMDENFRNQIWAVRGANNWDFHGASAVEEYRRRLEAIYSGETTDAVPCGLKTCDNTTRRAGIALLNSIYAIPPCIHCCGECPNLATCPNACPRLSDKIEVLKSQRLAAKAADKKMKEQEDAEREAQREEAHQFAAAGWKRLGDALDRSGKSALWLCERMDWDQDEEEMDNWVPLLEGKSSPKSSFWGDDHPLQDIDIKDMAELANELGVSLDYLCCCTDEPGMAKAEKVHANVLNEPTWQTGIPKRTGTYYCRIRFEEGQTMTLNLDYGTFNARWSHPATGEEVPYEVLGWWPLPEDDPEDAEDAEEDDEGDMDALWYGHEDDDDYLAESGEVLGADE